MDQANDGTAATASIEEVAACAARVDAQIRQALGRVMAQRRSVEVAFGYVAALSPGTRANCWSLAETAGHEGWTRMQALVGTYVWDWKDLRGQLPRLAGAWLPHDGEDLVGPGVAVDETADLKKGDATAFVAPQHAGCTGKVDNCVTTVFCAYVTTTGQTWVDFDVYMPQRWAEDPARRQAAGVPGDLAFATKPDLAIGQIKRVTATGLPLRWAAGDEVYGRSSAVRQACTDAGLAWVFIIPRDYALTTAAGTVTGAQQAVADAVFERRSCGAGSKGPRYSDWALVATANPREFLLIRRLISRPDQYTFYLCYAPPDRPATMTYFITIAGRRWPVEETFKTGKDVLGWDQSQIRSYTGTYRHTALSALAQLRQVAIRNALHGDITPAPTDQDTGPAPQAPTTDHVDDTDLVITLGDAPVPTRNGQPRPPDIGLIKLSVAETARLTRLAQQHTTGILTRTRLAFALRWSTRRRHHQATARWHHYSTRLLAATT